MTFPCLAGQAFFRPLLFKYIFITQVSNCLLWNFQTIFQNLSVCILKDRLSKYNFGDRIYYQFILLVIYNCATRTMFVKLSKMNCLFFVLRLSEVQVNCPWAQPSAKNSGEVTTGKAWAPALRKWWCRRGLGLGKTVVYSTVSET